MFNRKLHLAPIGRTSLFAAVVLISAGVSQAQITGSIWENFSADTADSPPSGTPNMTFSSSQINYGSTDDSSITGFMNYGGTTTTFGNIQGGSSPNDSADDIFVKLTGQVYLAAGNNSFDVGHDDGLNINVTGIGTVLDQPNPTSFVLTPFTIDNTGAAGDFTFTVDYNECCGAPAYLEWAFPSGAPLNGTVPDAGATFGLLGIGLTALGAIGRRFKK
jgi:hypothetical protein